MDGVLSPVACFLLEKGVDTDSIEFIESMLSDADQDVEEALTNYLESLLEDREQSIKLCMEIFKISELHMTPLHESKKDSFAERLAQISESMTANISNQQSAKAGIEEITIDKVQEVSRINARIVEEFGIQDFTDESDKDEDGKPLVYGNKKVGKTAAKAAQPSEAALQRALDSAKIHHEREVQKKAREDNLKKREELKEKRRQKAQKQERRR